MSVRKDLEEITREVRAMQRSREYAAKLDDQKADKDIHNINELRRRVIALEEFIASVGYVREYQEAGYVWKELDE